MSKIHYSVQIEHGPFHGLRIDYITDDWNREEVLRKGHEYFEDDPTSGYLIGVDDEENEVYRLYLDFGNYGDNGKVLLCLI